MQASAQNLLPQFSHFHVLPKSPAPKIPNKPIFIAFLAPDILLSFVDPQIGQWGMFCCWDRIFSRFIASFNSLFFCSIVLYSVIISDDFFKFHGATSFQGNQYEVIPNNSETPKKSQTDLAAQLGISVDTLHNYKMLAEMIPELDGLVSTGIVTTHIKRGVPKRYPLQNLDIYMPKPYNQIRSNQGYVVCLMVALTETYVFPTWNKLVTRLSPICGREQPFSIYGDCLCRITLQRQPIKVLRLPQCSLALPPFCFQKEQPPDYPYHVLI